MIEKPLLAANFDSTRAKFPYLATPKIDGIRFLMVNGVAVSRTFKPIRNQHIQNLLQNHLPDGIDGELTSGETFQSSTSAIMTIKGTPNFKVWIFDFVNSPQTSYLNRIQSIPEIQAPFEFEVLKWREIHDLKELEIYEEHCLQNGYEGVMLRDPHGPYKFGRSTVNENILLKVKRFEDDEAELIRIEEKLSNQNPEEFDVFGNIKRSASIYGMIPMNTTGTLVVRNREGLEFGIGSGLNDQMRDEIWKHQEKYLGKLVKFKYFPQGVKDLPRHPVFLGFRDFDDM